MVAVRVCKEAQLPAKFQLRKGTTGKFRFVVLSSNGQVVATSEAYERKASALAGIRSIEKIVQSNAAIEDTTTKEYAEAAAAKKAAKKNGAKKAVAKTKKLVTKAAGAAPAKAAAPAQAAPAKATAATSSTKAAKAAVKGAAKSGTRTPVRKAPPPLTTPPGDLTPKI
jgi:uncharacterized protein YegP (UPF0339 family)